MRISDWSSDVCSSDLLAPGLARNLDRGAHRQARFFRIPQIAFEIEDRTGGDQIAVERAFGQELRRAEKGVHRPLAIGRSEERRVGQEGVRPCRCRWSTVPKKKKK